MTYNEQVAQRMTEFLQGKVGSKHGWQKAAATLLDMANPQNLRPYLIGDRTPAHTVLARLYKLGCDINWLLFGPVESNVQSVFVSLQQIPVYESVHAGSRKDAVMETPSYYIAIPKMNDETLFGVKVKGSSMASYSIPDGCVVICSRKEEIVNGKPHMVSWSNGESVVRIVTQDGNYFTLSSSDPIAYPPLRIHKKDIHHIYRVTKILIDP